jgi:tripartite-type tricarboxylate transporter receptor subunit TctC
MKLRQRPFSLARCVALLVAASFAATAAAQQTFPSRPIRLVLPYPSGFGTEVIYRVIAEHMAQALGQPVLIDSRPGGGGLVGAQYLKSQPADGHTLYLASNMLITNSVGENPQFHVLRDFTPIAPVTDSVLYIGVNAEQIKATTLKEFVELVRANPGKFNYASYGIGGGGHIFFELLANEAKLKWVHVPYPGTAQAAGDTAAGRTQVTAASLAALGAFSSAEGGRRLRVIGSTRAQSSPQTPEIPGMAAAGFPQIDYGTWSAFVGIAGIPRDIVVRLNQAINTANRDPKQVELYRKLGGTNGVPGTPEDLQRNLEREYNNLVKLVKETGIKLQQ